MRLTEEEYWRLTGKAAPTPKNRFKGSPESELEGHIAAALAQNGYVVEITPKSYGEKGRHSAGATAGIGDLFVWAEWWKRVLPGMKQNLEVKTKTGVPTPEQVVSIERGGLPIVRSAAEAVSIMQRTDHWIIILGVARGIPWTTMNDAREHSIGSIGVVPRKEDTDGGG